MTLENRPHRLRFRLKQWRLIYRVGDGARVVGTIGIRLKTGPGTYDDIE